MNIRKMVWDAVGCWLLLGGGGCDSFNFFAKKQDTSFYNEMSSSVDDAITLDFSKQIKLSVTGGYT